MVNLVSSRDGLVRSAKVLSSGRIIGRPLNLLCPIEISGNCNKQHEKSEQQQSISANQESVRQTKRTAAKHAKVKIKQSLCDMQKENVYSKENVQSVIKQTYYEDISKDDSVFDLIDDMERLRSQDERIADFELNYLDNITLGHVDEVNNNGDWNDYDAEQMDDQNGIVLGDVINGGNSVRGSDGDIVERDEAAGIAGVSINDGVSVSGNDAGIVGVSVNNGSSVYGGVSGSGKDAGIVGDSVNDGSSVYGGMSVSGSDAMNSEDSVDGGVSLNIWWNVGER